MLKLKVRKIGDSLGARSAQGGRQPASCGEGDRLFLIEGPSGGYQLTPYDPVFGKKMKKAEEIIGRYRSTLHTLSK